jgi:hypothetical protein
MRRSVLIVGLITAVLGAAVPAFAQFQPPRPRNERPQRGLFGEGTSNTEQRLVMNLSFGGGYDDDILGQGAGAPIPGPAPVGPRTGEFAYASAGLTYNVSRETVQASANLSGTGQYFPDYVSPRIFSMGAGLQASWQITPRSTLSTSNQFTLQPNTLRMFYGQPIDAQTPPDSVDTLKYSVGRVTYQDFRSSVGFDQYLTEKLAANLGYTYYSVDYSSAAQSAYRAHTLSGQLRYSFTKSFGAHAGYGHTSTEYDNVGPTPVGNYSGGTVDAGVDFGKALSLTRRTSLGFGTGISGIRYAGDSHYFFTGFATLTHEVGRSWTAALEARRSTNFYQTFGEPVISDSVTGGISGLLNRRVTVGAHGGWSRGTVGVVLAAPEFSSLTAGGMMRWAMSSNMGLTFSYSVFNYMFDEATAPPPFQLEPEMRRQTALVTFDFTMPLVTVARRANASR